jgi:hypothetical protein
MTIAPADFWGPVQLGASAAILGAACPANTKQVIKRAVFTNMDTVNRTVTIYVSRNGATLSNANCIVNQQVIPPPSSSSNGQWISPELANLVLGPGDAIYALADVASKVNTVGSGYQQ